MGKGRPPLPLGTWGKVQRFTHYGTPGAMAYVRDSDGKRRRVIRTGRTYAEAERLLSVALRDRVAPTSEDITRDTLLEDLAEQWLDEVRRDERAVATIGRYASTIRSHVVPVGNLRLSEATVPRLQRLVDGVADRAGPAAARMLRVVLKGMFGLAARHGALDANPVAHVKGPKRKRQPVRAPSLEQIHELRALLEAYDRRASAHPTAIRDLADIGDVLIGTGARIGEVLALTWDDIDLKRGRVTIASTVARVEGGGLILQGYPKTESSIRRLAVPPFVRDLLYRRSASAFCNLVFPSATGTPRWPENVRAQWATAVKGTALEGFTTRSCRKAVATHLKSHANIEAAAGQLGHSSPRVTELFYVPLAIDRPDHSEPLNAMEKPADPRVSNG